MEQLLGYFWRNREKKERRQNERLRCRWMNQEERPELKVLETLETCLWLLVFYDCQALERVEREQLYFKYLRRKVDNEKLETILNRYRDDTIKNLVMAILQLEDADQEKTWYESYASKGLDLETWNDEKCRPQTIFGQGQWGISGHLLLTGFIGQTKAIYVDTMEILKLPFRWMNEDVA